MKLQKHLQLIMILCSLLPLVLQAQQQTDIAAQEEQYYHLSDIAIPDSIILEVGGMAFTDDDRLGICTRRGEVWIIDQPYSVHPTYQLFAQGLHEPLGLAYYQGAFYTTQRSELTKINDTDKDGRADLFRAVYSWPLSGNYHEYSYGPLFLPNGDMLVTLNLGWIGRGASLAKWTGLCSPAGFGIDAGGNVFYAENQGGWINSGRITHLEKGDFAGNPVHLKPEVIPDSVGLMYDFAQQISSLKLPTVWFPHTVMGISTSDLLAIPQGVFGPFAGQLLVGDQGHSKVMRVFLEKVQGEYQEACFPFREGFASGMLRLAWDSDGTLFVGQTNRGWASTGNTPYALQRLQWRGNMPFEMQAIRAKSHGFEIGFTQAVDKQTASDPAAYQLTGFTYLYHHQYGSPIINQQACPVSKVEVSADGKKVRLYVQGLRLGYIHEVKAVGVRSSSGKPLLHEVGYYTLNQLPAGEQAHTTMIAEDMSATEVDRACGPDAAKNVTEQPSHWSSEAEVVINIGTRPGLKYDLEEFEVVEGSKVKLVFNNSDDMLHNLVITTEGNADKVGKDAMNMGLQGAQLGYVSDSEDVLFNTCLLQPETSQSIYFIAPKAGEYPYVCTFPGHYLNMRGIMKVRPKNLSLQCNNVRQVC